MTDIKEVEETVEENTNTEEVSVEETSVMTACSPFFKSANVVFKLI